MLEIMWLVTRRRTLGYLIPIDDSLLKTADWY
jgi:hypothetical protein